MTPCPSRFNLTFSVPRTSQGQTRATQVQCFEVVLDDAKRAYRLFLSYFRSPAAAEDDGKAEGGVAAEAYSSKVIQGHAVDTTTKIVTACVMTVAICLSVRLLCDVTVLRREKPRVTGDSDDVTDDVTRRCSTSGSRSTVNRLQRRHIVFIAVYIGFNVIYCVLVTFTAISAMFVFHFRSEIDHVTSGGQRLGDMTRRAILEVEELSARSLEMELELAENRGHRVPVACTRHVDELTAAVQQSIVNITQSYQRRSSTSVSGLMSLMINSTVSDIQGRLLKYVHELDRRFGRRADPIRAVNARYRYRVVNSAWLLYPRSLFNRSIALASLTTSSSSSSSAAGGGGGEDQVMRFLNEMMSAYSTSRHPRWYRSADLQR